MIVVPASHNYSESANFRRGKGRVDSQNEPEFERSIIDLVSDLLIRGGAGCDDGVEVMDDTRVCDSSRIDGVEVLLFSELVDCELDSLDELASSSSSSETSSLSFEPSSTESFSSESGHSLLEPNEK